jgi:hypothetical protein
MRKSIIKLTKTEFDFLSREDYPKIKQQVIQKLCQHFDSLGVLMQESISSTNETVMMELHQAQFKTTRGENYQQLPYVVLDYPKIKNTEFVLLFRTMCWWGNYFSLNVFLRTSSFSTKHLAEVLQHRTFEKVKLYTGDDLWQQDLNHKDFIKITALKKTALINQLNKKPYIKLSIKVPLKKWDGLDKKAIEFYTSILKKLA